MSVQRESEFQRVVIAFLKRAVMPPMFVTSIAHEGQATQNARARAARRGVITGLPDLYLCQAPKRTLFLELKWGKNEASDAQRYVADALWGCGIDTAFAWSIADVLTALRAAGMTLHGNANGMAVEYQARAEAAVARAELRAAKPARATKPRATTGRLSRKAAGFAARRLGL